jgi:SAM-dependent methyltransferase
MEARFAGAAFEALVGDITDPGIAERLRAQGFDTILCLNVLEHIERDDLALAAMARILGSAGTLFLLVPAHPMLYGTPDVLAGHHRRYSRRMLVERVRAAGLRLVCARFFNGFGAIPYFLNSRVLRPSTLAGAVDAQLVVFDRYVVPLLRRIERHLPMPFGQSLIVIAEARCRT